MPETTSSKPIYRILDYFELEEMLEENQLRFSRISTFVDENEGIEELIRKRKALVGPLGDGFGIGWETNDEAVNFHENRKNSHYASCWTLSPESIAMWSLYSKNHFGIRIQSTDIKLNNTVIDYLKSEGVDRLEKSEKNCSFVAVASTTVDTVAYVDLKVMYQKIAKRVKAFTRLEERKKVKHLTAAPIYDQYKCKLDSPISENPFLVKDEAFVHEKEIRGLIEFKRFSFNDELHNSILGQSIREKKLALSELGEPIAKDDCKDYIFLAFKKGFIEGVCIDPRCPEYIQRRMRKLFTKYKLKINSSSTFGYMPKAFDFSVDDERT
jgi:hypothetical protein